MKILREITPLPEIKNFVLDGLKGASKKLKVFLACHKYVDDFQISLLLQSKGCQCWFQFDRPIFNSQIPDFFIHSRCISDPSAGFIDDRIWPEAIATYIVNFGEPKVTLSRSGDKITCSLKSGLYVSAMEANIANVQNVLKKC